jgi:hypothetical protein
MKSKIAALLIVSGGFLMALGCNILPNVGSTLDLTSLLGGNG